MPKYGELIDVGWLGQPAPKNAQPGHTASYWPRWLRRVHLPAPVVRRHLIVTVIKVTLVRSWATEGTVFQASYYYRNVFQMYLPWFLVGGAGICVRWLFDRHS